MKYALVCMILLLSACAHYKCTCRGDKASTSADGAISERDLMNLAIACHATCERH